MLSDSPIKCTKLFSSTQPSEEPRWIHSVNNQFPINILTEPSGWMLTTCSSSSLENVAVSGLTWIKSKIRQSKDIRGRHPLHTAPPCRLRQSNGPCSRDAIKKSVISHIPRPWLNPSPVLKIVLLCTHSEIIKKNWDLHSEIQASNQEKRTTFCISEVVSRQMWNLS